MGQPAQSVRIILGAARKPTTLKTTYIPARAYSRLAQEGILRQDRCLPLRLFTTLSCLAQPLS